MFKNALIRTTAAIALSGTTIVLAGAGTVLVAFLAGHIDAVATYAKENVAVSVSGAGAFFLILYALVDRTMTRHLRTHFSRM